MIAELNYLAALKCEVLIMRLYSDWHVDLKTVQDGMKLEVKTCGPDLEDTFRTSYDKFMKVTRQTPELLPPMLAPPEPIPETPFRELDDEIPF